MTDKNKINIVFVLGNSAPVPDVLGGGTERLVTMIANQNEVDYRANITFISPYNEEAKKASLKYNNSRFVFIKRNSFFVKVCNFIFIEVNKLIGLNLLKKGYYENIANIIKDLHADIVIDENGYVPEVEYLSKAVGKNKLVARIHWNANPISRDVDGLYGAVIGVSNYVAESWVSNSEDEDLKKYVVYSAIDEKRFEISNREKSKISIRAKYGIPVNAIVLIYCGRIAEEKGIGKLIEAFNKINNNLVYLLIVGGQNLSSSEVTQFELKQREIASNNSNIIFTGYINNSLLINYYCSADIQVIPTIVEEAVGLVAIEGMYCGLPIIASDTGGLPEYVNRNCAIIVPKNERYVDNLADEINKLVIDDDRIRDMSLASLENSRKYTQKKYYDDYINCLEKYVLFIK